VDIVAAERAPAEQPGCCARRLPARTRHQTSQPPPQAPAAAGSPTARARGEQAAAGKVEAAAAKGAGPGALDAALADLDAALDPGGVSGGVCGGRAAGGARAPQRRLLLLERLLGHLQAARLLRASPTPAKPPAVRRGPAAATSVAACEGRGACHASSGRPVAAH